MGHHQPRKNVSTSGSPSASSVSVRTTPEWSGSSRSGKVPPGTRSACMQVSLGARPDVTCNTGRPARTEPRTVVPDRSTWSLPCPAHPSPTTPCCPTATPAPWSTRAGSVDWLCFPRFDSPSVFGRLLDDEAGHWQIRPTGEWTSSRRYLDRTLVLETTFTTAGGTLVLTDALAMGQDNGGHRLGTAVPAPAGPVGGLHRRRGRGRGRLRAPPRVRAAPAAAVRRSTAA